MYNKRTWEGLYESFIVTGAVLVIFAVLFIKTQGYSGITDCSWNTYSGTRTFSIWCV